jgi:hypothetical protein
MTLTTAQEYNLVVAGCCPCGIPLAPSPRKECESKSATSTSQDDDYTDALEEWNRKSALWEAYQEWLVADPETRGPEPENEGAPGEEPEPPENYEDVDHGSWAPFIQPDGEATDDIPTLYRTKDYINTSVYDGESAIYQKFEAFGGNGTSELLNSSSYTDGVFAITSDSGNDWNNITEECTGYNLFLATPNPPGGEQTEVSNEKPCEPDSYIRTIELNSNSGNSMPELQGCPGPFSPNEEIVYWDFTQTTKEGYQLAEGVSKDEVIARATAKIREAWTAPPEGTSCSSKVETDWPKIGDISPWPSCDDGPPAITGEATVTKARYRIGIPNTDEYAGFDDAHEAWEEARTEWLLEDPETRGPEPLEPQERSYYAAQWDEVFFPKEWEEWKVLKDAFDTATEAHEEWEAADPETRGPEPEIPADPGAAPTPAPSLIASRSFTYTGGAEFSEWFEIPIPEIEGETRIVNMMAKHYRSVRLGSLPTSSGEIYEF